MSDARQSFEDYAGPQTSAAPDDTPQSFDDYATPTPDATPSGADLIAKAKGQGGYQPTPEEAETMARDLADIASRRKIKQRADPMEQIPRAAADLVNNVGTGLYKGVADLTALPKTGGALLSRIPEPLAQASPMLGFSAKIGDAVAQHWPSSQDIQSFFFDRLGIPEYKPTTLPGKMVQGAAEAVPGAAAFGPGVTGLAAAGAALGEPAAALYPDHPDLARFATQVATGVNVPALAASGKLSGRLLAALVRPFSADGQERIVGGALRDTAAQPDALLGKLSGTTELVPASPTTTAEASGDTGLLAVQKALAQKAPGARAEFERLQAEQNAARTAALEGVAPQPQNAATTADFVKRHGATLAADQQQRMAAAQSAAQARIAALGPDVTPQAAGNIIREEYEAALDQMRQRVRQAYRAIDPNGTSAISPKGIYQDAGEIVGDYFGPGSGGPPKEITEIMTALRGENMPFKMIDNLQKRAANIAGQAEASGDLTTASAARQIAAAIRGGLDDAAARGVGFSPAQAAQYNAARALRVQQGAQFEEGASGAVGATKRFGEHRLSPAEVPGAYFNTTRGSADDAAMFIRTLGGRPRAEQALQDYAVRDLRSFALNPDGTINPTRLAQWTKAHDGALSAFPALRSRVNDVATAQSAVDALAGRTTQTIDDFQKSAARFFLKRDPDAAIDGVLRSSTARADMRELVALANKDPTGDALLGLRRGIIDHALAETRLTGTDTAGMRLLSNAKFQRWFDAVRPTIAPAFEQSHLQMLDRISQDLQRGAQLTRGAYGGGSPTFQNLSAGSLLQAALGGAAKYVPKGLLDTVMRPIAFAYKAPEEAMQAMYTRALVDPEYARTLLLKVTPENAAGIGQRLVRQIGAATAAATAGPGVSGEGSRSR